MSEKKPRAPKLENPKDNFGSNPHKPANEDEKKALFAALQVAREQRALDEKGDRLGIKAKNSRVIKYGAEKMPPADKSAPAEGKKSDNKPAREFAPEPKSSRPFVPATDKIIDEILAEQNEDYTPPQVITPESPSENSAKIIALKKEKDELNTLVGMIEATRNKNNEIRVGERILKERKRLAEIDKEIAELETGGEQPDLSQPIKSTEETVVHVPVHEISDLDITPVASDGETSTIKTGNGGPPTIPTWINGFNEESERVAAPKERLVVYQRINKYLDHKISQPDPIDDQAQERILASQDLNEKRIKDVGEQMAKSEAKKITEENRRGSEVRGPETSRQKIEIISKLISQLEEKLGGEPDEARMAAKALETLRPRFRHFLETNRADITPDLWTKVVSLPQELELLAAFKESEQTRMSAEAENTSIHKEANVKIALQALAKVEETSKITRLEKIKSWTEGIGKKSKEFGKFAEQKINTTGEWYNSQPLHTKLLLSGALISSALLVSGGGCGVVIGSALTGAKVGRSVLAWAGTYVAMQAVINKSRSEGLTKKGREKILAGERNINWLTSHNPKVTAAALSVVLVLGTSYAANLLMESMNRLGSMTESPEAKKTVLDFTKDNYPLPESPETLSKVPAEISAAPDTPPPTLDAPVVSPESISRAPEPGSTKFESPFQFREALPDHIAVKGETLSEILRKNLLGFLPPSAQENALQNLLAKVKDPREFGISSGDLNKLSLKDNISLQKFSDLLEQSTIKGEGIIEHALTIEADASKKVDVPSQAPLTLDAPTPIENPFTHYDENGPGDFSPHQIRETDIIEGNMSQAEISSVAENQVNKNLDIIFASAGVLSLLGLTRGRNSKEWKELSKMKASDIISTSPGEIKNDPKFQKYFGFLHQHLQLIAERTGIIPTSDEPAEKFLKRATEESVKKGIIL